MPDFRYDEASRRYYLGTQKLPSVTRILRETGNVPDFSAVPPAVLETARQRGIAVHAACQYLDEGDLDESTVAESIAGYVSAYRRFLEETGATVLDTEIAVCHPTELYAGRYDVKLWLNGRRWILDRKATATLGEHVGVQCAAYANALNAMHGDDEPVSEIGGLLLKRDGTYGLTRYEYLRERRRWYAVLAKWRVRNQIDGAIL